MTQWKWHGQVLLKTISSICIKRNKWAEQFYENRKTRSGKASKECMEQNSRHDNKYHWWHCHSKTCTGRILMRGTRVRGTRMRGTWIRGIRARARASVLCFLFTHHFSWDLITVHTIAIEIPVMKLWKL